MTDIVVRKLEIEDSEAISKIYAAITQKPVEIDFKR
ncbi:MAG: N-acetyltransferase, partial [Desulfobacterales bacterium CG07_land_8_20_14_0_80_52_14]